VAEVLALRVTSVLGMPEIVLAMPGEAHSGDSLACMVGGVEIADPL
jgi:hypothetical protein